MQGRQRAKPMTKSQKQKWKEACSKAVKNHDSIDATHQALKHEARNLLS